MGPRSSQLAACETGELTTRIVSAVSTARGVDPLSLPPLGETVDFDALEAFVDGVDVPMAVSFTHRDLRVRVESDGRVTVGGNGDGE